MGAVDLVVHILVAVADHSTPSCFLVSRLFGLFEISEGYWTFRPWWVLSAGIWLWTAFISHTRGPPFALDTLFLEERGGSRSSKRDALVPVPLASQYLMAHWIFPMGRVCVWCKSTTNHQFKAIIWNLIMENLLYDKADYNKRFTW